MVAQNQGPTEAALAEADNCYEWTQTWRTISTPWGTVVYPYWTSVQVDC